MDAYEQGFSRLRWQLAGFRVQAAMLRFSASLKAGFRPEQPRVPRGQSEGGQWTLMPGYARIHRVTRRRSGGGQIRIGGRWLPITPAQQVLLAQSHGAMRRAIRDVRKADPNWKPPAQLYSTVEGLISANRAIEREARNRLIHLREQGVGMGRYTVDSLPARNSLRRFTIEERRTINKLGQRHGCHTCGSKSPGTRFGNFVIDHQLPSAGNYLRLPQRLVPHCLSCSRRQGGIVRGIQSRRID